MGEDWLGSPTDQVDGLPSSNRCSPPPSSTTRRPRRSAGKKCAMIGGVDPKALRQTFKGEAVA